MGLGKRFQYNIRKADAMNPGPGQYALSSMFLKASRSIRSSRSNPRLAFGVARETQDKIQHHGMEKHFMGRYGADPGTYEMAGKLGSQLRTDTKSMTISKSDRGLHPMNDA